MVQVMNEDTHSTQIELDGYSTASSSYADFGDTGDAEDEELAKNADLINIREANSSSSDEDVNEEDSAGHFPPTFLVLRLHPKIKPDAISWLVHKITAKKSHGGAELLVRCEPFKGFKGESLALHITATTIRFLEVAEFLELKKIDERGLLREFQVRELDAFLHGEILIDTLITPAEKELIVLNELQNIRALPGEPCVPGYDKLTLHSGQSILHVYVTERLINSYFPLHDEAQLSKLLGINWFWAFWHPEPFEELRRYFGEAITLYFTFSGYYTSCLVPPALLALILTLVPSSLIDKKTYIVFFCVFNLIWVTMILKYWRRKCSELAYTWGTLKMSRWEEPRLNYRGKMSVDPVTGQYQPKYPWWKTGVKVYLVSMPLVITCMAGAFMVMVYYFKAEELLKPYKKTYDGTWGGYIVKFIASIVYAVLVAVMTQYYRQLADMLTEWENHRTQVQYDKHRVAKLVAFEFVNNFMSFIYIAFILKDLDMLKSQLLVMLIIMHLIVAFQEAILPLFIRKTSAKMKDFLEKTNPKNIRLGGLMKPRPPPKPPTPTPSTVARSNWVPSNFGLEALATDDPRIEMSRIEGKMDPYKGSFDDYLQLFIQFGYVFLFSPVFPLAAALAAVTNVFLIWANVFKLCQVFQRPIPKRTKDIGTWQMAFELMGFLSVMTNCALIALTFDFQSNSLFQNTSNEYFFFFIVVCEHLLVALKLGINKVIPNVPFWVKIAMARIEYKARMAFKKEQQVKSRRRLTLRFQVINLKLREQEKADYEKYGSRRPSKASVATVSKRQSKTKPVQSDPSRSRARFSKE